MCDRFASSVVFVVFVAADHQDLTHVQEKRTERLNHENSFLLAWLHRLLFKV